MWCGVITLFPDMFRAISDYGITRRAIEEGLLDLEFWNPRMFTQDRHQTVDDRPYGGGPGMVMQVQPLREAIHAAKNAAKGPTKVVYLSPAGKKLDTKGILHLAKEQNLVLIAGRYEGIDERLIDLEVDEEWSIGDYVITGGELAVMVLIDAMTRWLPGALGHEDSAVEDSFTDGLLDCPHYTRPEIIEAQSVPAVLLSGDHKAIARWRLKQQLGRTYLRRPDLLETLHLDKTRAALLQEFITQKE
jgi:tRNA (guanine37-N1)-methyltransferase